MNFRKLLYAAALVLSIAACKKEQETETTPSLDGYLKIHGLPEFIRPGEKVILKASGVEHPEGKAITYHWKVTPSQTEYTEAEVFEHTFSDTLRTYTVNCYVAAEGYSNSYASSYATAVAPGYNGSITGISYNKIADDSLFVRHMPVYYKTIGSQTWTINNLGLRSGKPFRNADVMSEVFGRYYDFNQAKAVCDSLDRDGQNWELPSMEDWAILEAEISAKTGEGLKYGKTLSAAMIVDAVFNGNKFWEYWPAIGEMTNASGFSAISTGYANILAGSYEGEFEYAAFWTSDQASSTEGYYKYMICDQNGLFNGKGNKESFGASVRCIRK